MRKPKFKPGTKERMRVLLRQAETAIETKRIQRVLFGACGTAPKDIGPMAGFHPQHVRIVWRRHNRGGEGAILGERRGKGLGRAFLARREEGNFLKPFFDKAKKGGMLIAEPIKKAYGAKVGREVHFTAVHKTLARREWRKMAPRPAHPKSDNGAQESLKAFFPIPGAPRKGRGAPEK